MSDKHESDLDPVAYLDQLDADKIASEIAALKSRQAALAVLLRAAKARAKGKPEKAKRGRPRKEAVVVEETAVDGEKVEVGP